MTSYMLNRRHFSKCLPSTNLDFHCFFQQNLTSQEEYETTRTRTTPQYFILSPFQYCNDVTLFSKVVSILISVVSWLSTENTFLRHFDFLTSEKICSCLRAFSKMKLKLKCLVQTWPDCFTVILSKSCYTRTSNQSKCRSKAQTFHLLEDIVTNFIVKWNKRKITTANFSQYTCQHIIRNSQQIRTLNWICRYFMMHVFIVSVVRSLRKTLIVYRIFPGFSLLMLV